MNEEHKQLSLSQAAAFLGLSRSTFARHYADKIPSLKPTPKSERRWTIKHLREWSEENARPR